MPKSIRNAEAALSHFIEFFLSWILSDFITTHQCIFYLFLCVSNSHLFLISNCSDVLDLRSRNNLKNILFQKLFWPFTVWIDCSTDLKIFANSRPSVSNINFFSRRRLKQFWDKIPLNNWQPEKNYCPSMSFICRLRFCAFENSWYAFMNQ